jgi:hypothetical protein
MARPIPRDESLGLKLLERVIVTPDGCFEWQGGKSTNGYGAISIGGGNASTHRVAFTVFRAPIPPGKMVCHRCDNRICCNPAHLFLGTAKDNITDCVQKKRNSCGTRQGSAKLTDDEVVSIRQRYSAGQTQSVLAREFGISQGHMTKVINGTLWAHLGHAVPRRNKPRATAEQVDWIRSMARDGMSQREIAGAVGLNQNTISRVLLGKFKYANS